MPPESKVVFGGRFRVNMTFWRPPLFVRDVRGWAKLKINQHPTFVTKWQSRYLKEIQRDDNEIYFWDLSCKAPTPHCQEHSANNKWKCSLFRCLRVSPRREREHWHDRTGRASKALNRFYPSGSGLGCIEKLKSENLCFFWGGGGAVGWEVVEKGGGYRRRVLFCNGKRLKIRKEIKRNMGVRPGMQCLRGGRFGPPVTPIPLVA